jgi:hypothetical protein
MPGSWHSLLSFTRSNAASNRYCAISSRVRAETKAGSGGCIRLERGRNEPQRKHRRYGQGMDDEISLAIDGDFTVTMAIQWLRNASTRDESVVPQIAIVVI